MDTQTALQMLGVGPDSLTELQRRALQLDGYFIVENVFTPAECADMAAEFDRLHAQEGERGGHEVHVEPGAPRVSNIFNKSAVFDRCLSVKPLLAAAQLLLSEIK